MLGTFSAGSSGGDVDSMHGCSSQWFVRSKYGIENFNESWIIIPGRDSKYKKAHGREEPFITQSDCIIGVLLGTTIDPPKWGNQGKKATFHESILTLIWNDEQTKEVGSLQKSQNVDPHHWSSHFGLG